MINSRIIRNPRIIFSLLHRRFYILNLYFSGYSYFLSIYNTDKQPKFVSCFSTREKPRMRGRGAKDIESSGNVTLVSFQCPTGEVVT